MRNSLASNSESRTTTLARAGATGAGPAASAGVGQSASHVRRAVNKPGERWVIVDSGEPGKTLLPGPGIVQQAIGRARQAGGRACPPQSNPALASPRRLAQRIAPRRRNAGVPIATPVAPVGGA